MPNDDYYHKLTFQALADPTRRQILERLSRGPATTTELAGLFELALPNVFQHLQVLERSHLIRSEKVGRVRTYGLVPQQLESAEKWLKVQRKGWEKNAARSVATSKGNE